MSDFELYLLYVPMVVLLFFIIILAIYIYSNKMLIKELQEDTEDNNERIKNIIHAVNYNDKKLLQNQRYIFDVYEENNHFVDILGNKNTDQDNSDQYYNMMKNYDALISLTK